MYKLIVKRLLDIIVSLIALPFLILIIIIVSPIIVIDDGFPIFYNANRIGKNGKLFKMYKFRSMMNNAPDIRLENGDTYNAEDDPRVTKVGKILRKYSIDELPQLFNVLIGNMSLIGPRPDPPDWLDRYTQEEKAFLSVKPGITGYSQAYFRNSVDGKEKIKNDIYYSQNCSFLLDIKILIKTVISVFKSENIYRN